MDFIQRLLKKVDAYQRKRVLLSFPYAVIKKYGEDQGGYQAALLTYYGFLSLFPLLLVLTTLTQWLLRGDSHVRSRIVASATSYIPILGSQLQNSSHGFSKTGLPLIIGLLALAYGTRGVADAFRHTVNTVWEVPITERSGFFPALARSFSIIGLGGLGFLGSAIIASYATTSGHDYELRILYVAISAFVLFGSFLFVIKTALSMRVSLKEIWVGAAVATVGLLILQALGVYIITHELKNLNNLYGTFAVVLGLLFWLYLQTKLVVYAIEIDAVRIMKLWPRNIFSEDSRRS